MFPFYKKELISESEILDSLYRHFLGVDWTQDTYIIHGKTVTPKRKTFMYGKKYSYSGITKEAVPFDREVEYIAKRIEDKLGLQRGYFNGCLCNLYSDGEAYMSYHKDNEPELDNSAVIVGLSLGATRKFYIKNDTTKVVEKFLHNAGEMIVMSPETQSGWTHSVPKELKVKEPRISLTFRRFVR